MPVLLYLCVDLIKHIRSVVSDGNLPGEAAHLALSPSIRVRTSDAKKQPGFNPKQSAVLILLYPENGIWQNVLIRRPEYPGTHSGQIAFPGGRFEANDKSFEHTALRECEEEIGVSRNQIQVLGKMTEVYIPPSNFLVHPYIGYMEKRPEFIPDPVEVKEIITYPVDWLRDPKIVQNTKIRFSTGFSLDTPYFNIHNQIVWGATAIMLSEFREIIKV